MKNLIPEDDYGMFADQKGVARSIACLWQRSLKSSITMCCVISNVSLHLLPG